MASPERLATFGDGSDPDRLLALALASLEDDKAEDIVTIDLRGKTAIFDYMIVATGRSTRHVTTIAEKLMQRVKDDGALVPRAEGMDTGDWVLVDARDVIVHVFRPEVREFYNIERMWTGPASDTA